MRLTVGSIILFFALLPIVHALECVSIQTAAINPQTNECAYFETTCLVPPTWKAVSYCPEDDIQFFRISRYIPSLMLLLGTLVGFFIISVLMRNYLSAEQTISEVREPFFGRFIDSLKRVYGLALEKIHSIHMPSFHFRRPLWQSQRKIYRKDIELISKAIVPAEAMAKEEPTSKTNWQAFKDSLEKLESLNKKKTKE